MIINQRMIPGVHVAIIIILQTLCNGIYIFRTICVSCVARGVLECEPTLLDHILDNSWLLFSPWS